MSHDVVESVRELVPAVRERAERTEADRRVSDEVVAALLERGLFGMALPKRYGGTEAHPVDFFTAVRALAAACPSTGWVASLLGAARWHLAMLPPQAQDEVWDGAPDALVSASYAPSGRLVPVEGGYRLSGEWKSVPGVDHSTWCMLGCLVLGQAEEPVDYRSVLVPRSDYRVAEAWNVVGLHGAGSRDVTVRGAFVPAHRVYDSTRRDRSADGTSMRLMPLGPLHCVAVTMPVVGAAEGAYAYHLDRMRRRNELSRGGRSEDGAAHVAVARGEAELDAAVLQVERDLRELVDHAERGVPVPKELRLRARRDQVRATERSVEALDLLFKVAGGHSVRMDAPIQRAWRDAHTAAAHVANSAELPLSLYGCWAHGLDADDTLLLV